MTAFSFRPARHLGGLTAALALFALPAAANAVELQMASGYPDTNFLTQTVQAFIADVEKRTDGDVTITLHNNQTLVKLPDMIRAVQTGQVAMADVRLGNYGNDDPVYVVDAIPNLAGDYDSALELWDASRPYLTDSFAKRGLKVLFAMWNPPQGFFTEEPLETAEDFDGLKMRIYSTGTSTMAGLLGAEPKEVPFSEVAQAFSTGLINSMFTSPQTGIDTQAWDFTKDLTMVGALFTKQLVSINADVFDGLPKEDQDAILAAAADAEKNGFALMQSLAKDQLALIASKGMTVSDADEAVMTKMSEVGATMLDEWMKAATPEQAKVIEDYKAMK
ncbi:TRAP transporter substrate-binding protein [Martelella sp. HB161492]|uniref:TRAP transporter substrate-binding protein n=1 Tax=Martelella sp. HB161492 TaxID=2720726 RepID=UPI00159236FD|nr:TRAP transporter substrate-binding protein [Martelella sp. HB161492]